MKIAVRYLIIVSFSICLATNCYSVNDTRKDDNLIVKTTENDSLKARINKLEKLIEDGSYTRIPNKDFENLIDNKIQGSIRDTIKWWIIFIGALITVLGFIANKLANTYLQNIVDGKVNQLKNENEERIKSISNHYFSIVIDSLLEFKIGNIAKMDYVVEESVVNDLERIYLKDDSISITRKNKVYLIDTIMHCYYCNPNFQDRIKKMIELIKKYEEEYTLLASTYFNAAIAFSVMYHKYGSKDSLNAAFENCNKSLKILPDYGLAFALKLELYIMAISKAFDLAEETQFKNELLKVFKDIENNQSEILCKELISRLEMDKESYFLPYLENLYQEYAVEMTKIIVRSSADQQPAKQTIDPINLEKK